MDERTIIKIIKQEYEKRLLEVTIAARIAEAELQDKRGNVIVAKDLKVKHKDSGYEYTVDHIEGDGEDAMIHLRKPETPRFDPPDVIQKMNELDGEELMDLSKPPILIDQPEETESSDIFIVTAQEFEKDYVVD